MSRSNKQPTGAAAQTPAGVKVRYQPAVIEPKWQRYWREHKTFRAEVDQHRQKYYILDMFPYPSAAGLHVGHPEGYTATDILARYKRMQGLNVLHPMGWDAFGLPAEQYAIETGTHPRETTTRNIETFRRQIQALGFSYDWDREIATCDPAYYRWTQWIFLKLYERGLAYMAEVPVNWCPALGTVLANEEVIDGKSERGGHEVIRKPMRQWMLRITAYAERLLAGLDTLDWPENVKEMQRNWIGRSEGARIRFRLCQGDGSLRSEEDAFFDVFTTRPDTLFCATYCVLAPEHPLVERITTPGKSGRGSGVSRRGATQIRPGPHGTAERKDRGQYGWLRPESRQCRADADLGRRLCAVHLWHRGDYGRAGRRRTRLGFCPPV